MEKELIKDIERILTQEIHEQSKAGDLAFLCLTSKIELNFRDRIAVSLFQKYSENYKISREYKRCDLAILDNENNLVLIIEFKACYSFDFIKKNKSEEYIKAIEKDMKKSQTNFPGTPMYSVLFITHPKLPILSDQINIIKYRGGINKHLKDHTEIAIKSNAVSKLKKRFKVIENSVIIENDEAFNIPVDILYALIKFEHQA